jgi:hypothetical protein
MVGVVSTVCAVEGSAAMVQKGQEASSDIADDWKGPLWGLSIDRR